MKPGTRARLFLCPDSWAQADPSGRGAVAQVTIFVIYLERSIARQGTRAFKSFSRLGMNEKSDRGASGSTPGFEPGDRGSSPRGPANI